MILQTTAPIALRRHEANVIACIHPEHAKLSPDCSQMYALYIMKYRHADHLVGCGCKRMAILHLPGRPAAALCSLLTSAWALALDGLSPELA